ncbi:MAG: hypothetical protein AAGB15_15890 [Pseudomonadota bacterium]
MVSAASVETVLGKIAHHNADILGCVAAYGDHIYSSLPDIYDLVDLEGVLEYAANMFAMTDILDTDKSQFHEIFLEFQGHSFIARRLSDGYLLMVAKPVPRSAFRRMQMGLNLFMRPLERALRATVDQEAATAASVMRRPASRLRRVFGGLA